MTRSLIALKGNDGSIKCIYVHCDGYPSYMAPLLHGTYNTVERIADLINHGSASYIDSDYENCDFYSSREGEDEFDKPFEFKNEQDFRENAYYGATFRYLFKDGEWYYDFGCGKTKMIALPHEEPDPSNDESIPPWW